MSNVDCPACLTDSGVEIDRTILEEGLEKTFECENCGHVWTVVF